MLKESSIRYMYHGTSLNNLSSILSEGLNEFHGKVYDGNFQNTDKTRSLESYGGIYFSDNLRTALMAGFTSAEKNKIDTAASVLVMVKIEDKTPSILIDEDLLASPFHAIYQVAGNPDYPRNLAEWVSSDFPGMDQAVDFYLNSLSTGRTQIDNSNFLNNLKPYIPNLLSSFAVRLLSIQLNKKDFGTSDLLHYYPQFEGLNMNSAIQNYRDAASLFMQKANRLTSFMNDSFQNNVRITEPISYRGKNKIVLVSIFNREKNYTDYFNTINIEYLSDNNALEKYISDIKEKYSNNFLMKYKNQIIYDQKKDKVANIGKNWYKFAQQIMLGYKGVAYNPQTKTAYSFWGGQNYPIDITIGNTISTNSPKGMYLASSKQYVLDYYSGMTDGEELLLTYQFDVKDALSICDTSGCDGEMRVKKATLVNVEHIDKDENGELVEGISPWSNNELV